MHVLVTGAAGKVGRFVAAGLRQQGHLVRGSDIVTVPDLDETMVGDLGDYDFVRRAVEGVEAIVHLGGNPGEKPWPEIRNNNYVGCYNVFEAARELGVRRIAFSSRAGLLSSYPGGLRRTIDMLPRPNGLYDNSKIFGEALGYMYWARFDMEVVSVRIGNFNPERDQPEHPHQLSHSDCVRVFTAAITHPGVGYEAVFGVSDSDWPLYDLDHGRRVIGYHPQDMSHVAEANRDTQLVDQTEPLPWRRPERVLVTGAGGKIGSVVAAGLSGRYQIRGLDRCPMPDLADHIVGDVADPEVCHRAMEGIDAVIHLAGVPSGGAPFDEVLTCNFDGTYYMIEAARAAGVSRFVYASRAGLLGPYGRQRQRTNAMVPLPESYYSISKVFGEGLGHMYAHRHDLQFVSIRIGNFKPDRPEPEHPHQLGHGDAVELFERAILQPDLRYEIVFGVSASDWPLYDMEQAKEAIGYEPKQVSHVPVADRE
ncbi:MAG: NAD(P)-dependent oxidoreductase [Gemmatimonadetes bacterium]|jgi:uronate dehydrogenase|nr:NAD(P)-dependent oxidoreductase [Gemmatimonadota bacterium]MBT6149263.1 NAD(P)-dependent oxidoreductase [Gemmatimonadota bacterium]MBT7859828.1 NAD(P)-dependent oxidoreductase [Gemmatimonadota bacterium]